MKITSIAEDAINLFLEYRDNYGQDENKAKESALHEILEGTNELIVVDKGILEKEIEKITNKVQDLFKTIKQKSVNSKELKRSMFVRCQKGYGKREFIITKVVNSTRFVPGLRVKKEDLDQLISEGWTITLTNSK